MVKAKPWDRRDKSGCGAFAFGAQGERELDHLGILHV